MVMKPEDVYDAIEGCHPGQLETGNPDDLAIQEQVQAHIVLLLVVRVIVGKLQYKNTLQSKNFLK